MMQHQIIRINDMGSGFETQNNIVPIFGFFKKYRESKGIKLSDIAKKLGYKNISKGCRRVYSWENEDQFQLFLSLNSKTPSLWSLPQILSYFGVIMPNSVIKEKGEGIGFYDYLEKILELDIFDKKIIFCCKRILPTPTSASKLELDSNYDDWKILFQNIQYKGRTILHWDYDLPPVVA